MNKIFEKICRMSQSEVKDYVKKELEKTHEFVFVDDGFVYAQGTFPVLLVAHMDTVHKEMVQDIIYDGNLKAYSSPQGIGGDDRCGIYMALEVVKKFNCSVVFCEDEETGMVGARKFTRSPISSGLTFNYIIEFDRQGENDAVFYECNNGEFEDFITKEFYRYAYGSFSDISTIAPYLKCAAVNLSCGYYRAHTTSEYVIIPQMEASIEAACKILERTTDKDVYEYIEYQYSGYAYGYSYSYDDTDYCYRKHSSNQQAQSTFYSYCIEYVDEDGETQWDVQEATSIAEAIGLFCMDNSNIPYESIIDIMKF
jgi:hypothetical protein